MSDSFRRQWILASKVIPRGYIVLGREPVVIGRARDCTLPIFHDSISRRHARVARQGARFAIEDLGSTNGTFVQGKKVVGTQYLEHDQVLTIGSVELRFLALEASRDELAARFDPMAGETTELPPMPAARSGALMSGSFTREVLLQVCQLIEVNHHTGVLRIEAGRTQGELRFKDGLIVGAKFASFRGEKAARTLLRLTAGDYAFKSRAVDEPSGEPLRLSAIAVSLDILHEQDRQREGQTEFKDRAAPSEPGAGAKAVADDAADSHFMDTAAPPPPVRRPTSDDELKALGETKAITRKLPRQGPAS